MSQAVLNPGAHAERYPNRPAVIMTESGETLCYRELDDRSMRVAQLMHAEGLRRGDHVAIFMENHLRYFEIYWAAMRSGLYVSPVNKFLGPEEAAYIVNDCGAKILVTSHALAETATAMVEAIPSCPIRLMVDGAASGYRAYEDAIAKYPAAPLAAQPRGSLMLYSSGTTGRPKGIVRPLPNRSFDDPSRSIIVDRCGFDENSVYLSPAPLYHGSPIIFCTLAHGVGATAVVMEKFDALEALRAIERHRVTHSQWVPTMFTRMLRLPTEDRNAFDLSSHRVAIHSAAPCPTATKCQMIDWWGPILLEFYGASEAAGGTMLTSEEWLARPGSVGRPTAGTIHICDEDGNEVPAGEAGLIYFELPRIPFQYHGDEEKTRSAQHPAHPNWAAVGDMGRVDEDGYLYLTDRKAFMINSGGVNIYPVEIENQLATHARVLDVAVIGVPNEEFGEEIKAVVQLVDGAEGSPELERELIELCRATIAHYKCPRSVDFVAALPRLPTGKLLKGELREQYWQGHETRIL